MVPNDDIMLFKKFLLPFDINEKVGVVVIQVVNKNIFQIIDCRDKVLVNPGFMDGRMGKYDQDLLHL